MLQPLSKSTLVRVVVCVGMLALVCLPASAQLVLKNEDVQFKFGVQGQFWADWTQDSTAGTQGYQQNVYLRRMRLIVGGDIGKDISFFFQTDDPKLGLTPKALGSGFIIQDAFVEWRANKAFMVEGGLMLVPLSRNTLQSPASYYTLDLSPLTAVNNTSTQSSGLRDAGFGSKGFFLKNKLQYRWGLFQGQRDANAHNSLRTAGYVQYDFFDTETGYTFVGTALGKKKILAVDAGFDKQGSYRGLSSNIAADLPVNHGDEIGGQFQYFHYDWQTKFPTIANQNDYLVEGAYYIHKAKAQPFMKAEFQRFVAAANYSKDMNRFGAGVNYYIHGQNLKWTLQYLRALPQNSSLKPSNEFTMQLQLFYF